jgi:hypothetical protein
MPPFTLSAWALDEEGMSFVFSNAKMCAELQWSLAEPHEQKEQLLDFVKSNVNV